MSLGTWVDTRLANFAPALAKELLAEDAPLVKQLQDIAASNEKAMVAAIPGAISAAVVNMPSLIAQAIKKLLPFPLNQ
jgi:hypothetical protein